MKVKVYGVLDKKASAYATPFFMPTDALALRAFGDVVLDKGSSISKHAEDYSLYELGEFDNASGLFKPLVNPKWLANALDYVVKSDVVIVKSDVVKE